MTTAPTHAALGRKVGDEPAPCTPSPSVCLRISATIEHEYASRAPDFLPLDKLRVGRCVLTVEEARAVLADAEYNSDLKAVDVGPYGTPLAVFNAYRALAIQARAAIAKATTNDGSRADGGDPAHRDFPAA